MPGDWICPCCRTNVFAAKQECFRCQTPNPGGSGGGGGSGGSSGGDRPQQKWADPAWRQKEIARRRGGGNRCASATCRRRVRAGNFCDQHAPQGVSLSVASPVSTSPQQQQQVAAVDRSEAAAAAELSTGQRAVLQAVLRGKNVFFTGDAGTGKSHLLRAIVAELRRARPAGSVFVTASTGIAAVSVGGITLHSFGGIGLGEESAQALLGRSADFISSNFSARADGERRGLYRIEGWRRRGLG